MAPRNVSDEEVLVEMNVKAVLILEDGTTYEGTSFGAVTSVAGEVVFQTGMVRNH